jgi:predicted phage terminase large subunit-like protein
MRERLSLNSYHLHFPHPPQALFMLVPHQEVLFGGAAGGGKTDALLMAALQYVQWPTYNAIIFRRTFPQLIRPGGLIPRSMEWLANTDADWNEQKKRWTWPSGASLTFAHLQYEKNKYEHQGAEYQFIGWDELTHFPEGAYRYLLSRLRRTEDNPVPLRVRATSNPGGEGHTWVKQRFLDHPGQGRLFIPSRLEDNPSLDMAAYDEALQELDAVDYARLRHGDWDIDRGAIFDRNWFKVIDPERVPAGLTWKRFWDLAVSESETADYTASVKGAMDAQGNLYLAEGIHGRWEWPKARQLIGDTCKVDGVECEVGLEQVAAWKGVVDDVLSLRDLAKYRIRGVKPEGGDKVARALPWSARAQRGQVRLVTGSWINSFLDHCVAFPEGKRDWIDAVSGLVQMLADDTPRPSARQVRQKLGRLKRR